MEKCVCFLSSSLVSSLLVGVEEEDKNDKTAEQNMHFLPFLLICLLITLTLVLPLGLYLWMLEENHTALGPSEA